MLKKISLFIVALGFALNASSQKLQSPSEFLGYPIGSQFTFHSRIVDYFKYVASVSKNVKLQQYGTTNEGRPLLAMFIASDQNISRLEDIRKNNLNEAGLSAKGAAVNAAPVVVWLSYNVHGNEPSSSETAMQALFELANPANARTQAWLKNTVVVIDPCLNPDGRDRYVNFFNSVRGAVPDANPSSREHSEPWPGGRINHYYFDLNRDWAWQTQKETQARVALYNSWLPQVHVDFHEQGPNAPYYFAPAAEPMHKDITPWQREFQVTIGKNNAKYFDQNGWLYFTKQEFDLLYPSYGDTYPLYNGSIGMTYEQGGSAAGGLAVVTRTGDTLRLSDRIAHHLSNSLSTVEVASNNAQKVLDEFKKFYDNSKNNPPGEYKTYVIKGDNQDKIAALAKLLDRNGIQYGFGLKAEANGVNYGTGKTEAFSIAAKDMVISAHQPKAVLLNVLMEPKTFMTDSITYDITAWALPYAYGLSAYGVAESLKPVTNEFVPAKATLPASTNAYAYVCAWQSVQDAKFLAALMKEKIKVRYTETAFEAAGKHFAPGSLIIARAGNDFADFHATVARLAQVYNRELTPLTSGFVDKGMDLGSSAIKYIAAPRVMLASNDGVGADAEGEVWHFFEQQLGYPITLIKYSDINRTRLSDFDIIILPDGRYPDFPMDKIQGWVRDGGKLIAIDGALTQLAGKKGFDLKAKEDKKIEVKLRGDNGAYDDRERAATSKSVPGAIYKLNMDNTHPLAFGMSKYYYSLKLNDAIYDYLGEDAGWNVGTVKKDGYVAGFVGQKAKEKIRDGMLLGVQHLGRGSVVYMAGDPLFRSFWENGKMLFSNALFMVQ